MQNQANLISQIDDCLVHEMPQRHSYFQLKYFLLGKEPTIQSKMWQCLKELKTRRESLDALEFEVDDSKDKIELLDILIQKFKVEINKCSESDPLSKKELEIKIRQTERQKKAAESALIELVNRRKYIEEEARFFVESFKNFEKLEPLKNFDDLESQKEYWSERLSQKMNLKMLTHNNIDTELIETIIALPDDVTIKKQALSTLSLRHENMVQQLKQTMNNLEKKEI